MKLTFYRSEIAKNFGDELNPWLWPKLLGCIFDENQDELFIGIGSILTDRYPSSARKIVLGAGYGAYTPPPDVNDGSWRFYFVRGPRTSRLLELPNSVAVTDGAVLVRTVWDKPGGAARWPVSFIPHWESLYRGPWESVCRQAGVHMIDPRAPVDVVLDEISRSALVLTEAMHGAIVSDALRVPWVPVLPLAQEHRFKWSDWTESLRLVYNPRRLAPSSLWDLRELVEAREKRALPGASALSASIASGDRSGLLRGWGRSGPGRFVKERLVDLSARRLRALARVEPMMSRDSVLASVTDRALEAVHQFRTDFGYA